MERGKRVDELLVDPVEEFLPLGAFEGWPHFCAGAQVPELAAPTEPWFARYFR
jgi:hypothetical protein